MVLQGEADVMGAGGSEAQQGGGEATRFLACVFGSLTSGMLLNRAIPSTGMCVSGWRRGQGSGTRGAVMSLCPSAH